MIWQNREITHILLLFKILRDTSSWPDNCTEISGASSSLKHIEIGPWLEGYWLKPLTPPTPWRGEWTSSALPFSPANVEVPLSNAINYYVHKWNDSVADTRRLCLCVAAPRCECTSLHGCEAGWVWKRLGMFCKTFTWKRKGFHCVHQVEYCK